MRIVVENQGCRPRFRNERTTNKKSGNEGKAPFETPLMPVARELKARDT